MNSRTIPAALNSDDEVDFGAVSFIEPIGLVAAAALTDRANRHSEPVRFIRPADFGARNYCARMGLGKHLDSLLLPHDLPTVNENPHPEDLLELRRFSSEFDGTQLAQLVYNRVSGESAGVDAQVPGTLHEALCELASNVSNHAEAPGFAAAQTYPNMNKIVFAVADGGIGIRQSLSGRYDVDSDAEALRIAVEYGVTGTGEGGRGSGLHDVMESVVGLQGTFTVISGSGKLVVTDSAAINPTTMSSYFPGTVIQGQLSSRP